MNDLKIKAEEIKVDTVEELKEEEVAQAEGPMEAAADLEEAEEGPDTVVEAPKEKVNVVPQELFQEVQEKYLRAIADIENLKRNHSESLGHTRERGVSDVIEELLPVLDNFSRALDSETENKEVKNFLYGMQMVRDQFVSSMDRFGLKKEETEGKDTEG